MVDKLNEDDKFSGRAGAAVIEILDRMESQKKPELAAKDEVSSSFYQRFGFIFCDNQPLKLYLPIWWALFINSYNRNHHKNNAK